MNLLGASPGESRCLPAPSRKRLHDARRPSSAAGDILGLAVLTLSLILVAAGLIAGIAQGGKISNLAKMEFRWVWLVFVGLAVQVGTEVYSIFVDPRLGEDRRGILLLASSYALLIAFLALNREKPGTPLMALGLLLNIVVIFANGGMPVSLPAARAAGFDPSGYLRASIKHQPMGPGTVLWFLGDIVPLPVLRNIVSVGDVLLGLGIFVFVQRRVGYSPRRRLNRSKEREDTLAPEID